MNLEEQIKIAIKGCGVNLYDIATVKENDMNIFRVFITSPNGINLDKCAEVSRLISPLLDIDEPMNGKYNLEVSSPGIERKLKKLEHFSASIGELVKIKTFNKEKISGKLLNVNEDETIKILTKNGEKEIAYNEVSSASTYFEW